MNAHSQEPEAVLRDWTIAERIEQLEFMLKFITDREYRRELTNEYLAYTTDPEERYERA